MKKECKHDYIDVTSIHDMYRVYRCRFCYKSPCDDNKRRKTKAIAVKQKSKPV